MTAEPTGEFATLRLARSEHTVTIELNRPEVRNAMSMQMCRDLILAFESLRSDASVRSILIRGAGPAFCSGIDLTEFVGKSPEWALERRNLGLDAFLAIENCPLPVIAAVHGSIVGAGGEIMAACDFAVAARGAKFRWPEVVWGAIGATQRLPRAVGMPMAKDLLFTGRTLEAEEALRLGLITRVLEDDSFEATVIQLQEQLASGFPLAARLVKKSMMLGRDLPIHIGIDIERQLLERSLLDSEWQRGLAAFSERKKT